MPRAAATAVLWAESRASLSSAAATEAWVGWRCIMAAMLSGALGQAASLSSMLARIRSIARGHGPA
jgi:hypothetical protein